MTIRRNLETSMTPESWRPEPSLSLPDFGTPDLVIEPTVGLGRSSKRPPNGGGTNWSTRYEINRNTLTLLARLKSIRCQILIATSSARLEMQPSSTREARILVIGNPPWVRIQTWATRSRTLPRNKLPRAARLRRPHGKIKLRHL